MAFEKPVLIQSFTAASAMTNSTNQFSLVKQSSTGTVLPCSAATDVPLGVLQNLPDIGQEAMVLMLGISKVRVGATDITLASYALIATDATGRAALASGAAGSQTYCVGRVIMTDAADNDAALVTAAINTCTAMLLRAF